MIGPAVPAVEVLGLDRAFDIFPNDRARVRHVLWSAVARLPGLGTGARRRRDAIGTRTWALRGVSFTVGRGESVGFIGANGSGKSTLLHVLCGTLAPSGGTVRTSGRIGALLELGTGFSADLTGRENVRLSGLLHGLDRATIAAREDDIAAFADIGPYLDQPVRTYSSGMYVRLAFAVMAHVDADVLIVDEALAVGDIRFVQKCLGHMDRFRAAGGTLVFVSHDLPAVQRLCSRVIWLDRGRLRLDGAPRDVAEAYFDSMIGANSTLSGAAILDRRTSGDGLHSGGVTAPPPGESSPFPPNAATEIDPPEVGLGRARIVEVRLVDGSGHPVTTVRGGERVTLQVDAWATEPLLLPVIGFYVKDRLGQHLFGENTLAHPEHRPIASHGFGVRFTFTMPRLFPGDYLIAVAIANGTQAQHVHHEWRHEAWHFTSMCPGDSTGLVGIDVDVAWS